MIDFYKFLLNIRKLFSILKIEDWAGLLNKIDWMYD